MLKTTTLALSLGMLTTAVSAELYVSTENKYKSPKAAHEAFLVAREANGSDWYTRDEMYNTAIKKGSVEARIYYMGQLFYSGAEYLKKGIKHYEQIKKYNDPVANYRLYLAYSRTGDQAEARKLIDIEKARDFTFNNFYHMKALSSNEMAMFHWNYARYTGNGYFNAPFEPKQVCDEVEAQFNSNTATDHERYMVGRCYFDGAVRAKDEIKGMQIFNELSPNYPIAKDTVAIIYTIGTEKFPRDLEKGSKLLGPGILLLGLDRLPEIPFYYAVNTNLRKENHEHAYGFLRKAAEIGDFHAQWVLDRQAKSGHTNFDVLDFIEQMPATDPKLPKGSPHLPIVNKGSTPRNTGAKTPEGIIFVEALKKHFRVLQD